MAVNIIFSKNQLLKDSYNGAIKERKVLGFQQENGPLQPYSNIFYWSHSISDFGCSIPEHTNIDFEIFTYGLKGTYETYCKERNQWIQIKEGDIGLIKAGKGIRHSDKFYPRSEVLQIWFDPDFDQYHKNDPELIHYKAENFPVNFEEGKSARMFGG